MPIVATTTPFSSKQNPYNMKKILLLALLIVMGATLSTTEAKKKDKKQKATPVALQSVEDSLCYATGIQMTNGLIPFLIGQRGVDTTYLYKFIEGFEAAMAKENNADELTAYAAGIDVAKMMTTSMLTSAKRNLSGMVDSLNIDMMAKGFVDALKKDHTVFNDSTAQHFVTVHKEQQALKIKETGENFLKENGLQPDVVTLPSGLQYKVLRQGTGAVAGPNDEVEVKYEGRLIDGTVFDSSYTRTPQTTTFSPSQVIKGWKEALTIMPEGSMWELYIPYNLAYGERGAGAEIPPFSTLIFKVEVEKVTKTEPEAK